MKIYLLFSGLLLNSLFCLAQHGLTSLHNLPRPATKSSNGKWNTKTRVVRAKMCCGISGC